MKRLTLKTLLYSHGSSVKPLKKSLLFIALLALPVKANALQDIYVIQFILDGVHQKVLKQEVEAGNLPHLKAQFLDQGAIFEPAITTFPTVSSPGYISFATGLSAGNSSVFFLEWFDRTKQKVVGYLTPNGHNRVNEDLINFLSLRDGEGAGLYSPLTLFEKLSPHPSAAIYTPFHRGATIIHPKHFPIRALFSGLVAKDGLALNRLAMRQLDWAFSKPIKKIPRYTLVGLYGTDFYGHHSGPASEEVKLVLKQFDQLLATFVEKLKEQKILDRTYLILSSDHGMHQTGKQLKLREWLWQTGIRKQDKIYVSNRGVSSTFITVGGESGWEEIPNLYYLRNFPAKRGPIDLIQTLLKNEALDWIALRDDFDRVRLYDQKGEGVIAQFSVGVEKFYSYLYQRRDPLGFANDPSLKPFLDGKPYSAEVWFENTAKTNRPNAVVELSRLFMNPRAGDILVVAKEAYGFRKAKAGTHGSLNPDDMYIPLWVFGPGIPSGRFGPARSVDLYPTILSWFGLLNPADGNYQEGSVLLTQKNSKPNPVAQWLAKLEGGLIGIPPLFKLPNREEISERLRGMIPDELYLQIRNQCEQEINSRYQRWKKLDQMEAKVNHPRNSLKVPTALQGNMEWLLANEKNIEFMRLRRMEDLKSILEER